MSGTSGLDFSSVGQELAYWLTHVAKSFMGGFPGSGENGYDFSMPEGTPVYAILPGKVVGVGGYGGGGVVAIQYNPQNVIYYQHLRENQATVGQQVGAGEQIGLSGGLTNLDGKPVSCCSSFPHIEVGINAPFGPPWNPNNVTPNANPIGLFNSLNSQYQANDVQTGGAGVQGGGSFVGLVGTGSGTTSSGSCGSDSQQVNIGPFSFCVNLAIYRMVTQPIRLLKLTAAGILLGIAVLLIVIPAVASPVLKGAGVVTGQPALVQVGSAIGNAKKKETRPVAAAQTDQLAFQAAQSRQQSNAYKRAQTTRNLGGSQPSQAEAQPQPSMKKQSRHAGTTSQKQQYDQAYQQRPSGIYTPKTTRASKAPPTPQATPIPPTRPKKPRRSIAGDWWRHGTEAITRYNRASKERTRLRKAGINPGRRKSREELMDIARQEEERSQRRSEGYKGIDQTMRDLRGEK